MEWQISFLEEAQVVVLETSGVMELTASLQMARAGIAAAEQRGWTRGLIDHRGLSGFAVNTIDLYDLPGRLREMGVGSGARIAEVVAEANLQDFAFLETVSVNRGLRLEVFVDRDAALRWLVEG